jgi:hypothetical protein
VDLLARFARWFAANPGAQLIAAAFVLMLVFPDAPVGGVSRVIVYGAIGIGVAWGWPSLPAWYRNPSSGHALAIALAIVGVVGVVTFYPVLSTSPSPEWQTGDWGPQHAVLAKLMPHLPGLNVPVWNHAVSTGDAPLELYPALTYLFTGHLAWLLGLENDLPHAFMIVATLVHLGLALTTTAVAARVAPKPIAVIVGLFWLTDSGALSHGGVNGLFMWALLHSAFAHVFSMIAALGIMASLVRPRLGASVAIWLGIAFSTAAHPAALITAATFAVALLAVAVLAADVPPRRALVALCHLALGLALGAVVWMPAAQRLLAYGQHYPNELYGAVHTVQMLLQFAMPMTTYSLIVFASYLGMLLGPWTRRAEVIFVAVVAFVMLLGLADATYLSFGLAPGKSVARLGVIRIMMLARPFVYACAAWVIAALYVHVRDAWRGRAPRPRIRWVAPALIGVLVLSFARLAPELWSAETDRAIGEANKFAPDRDGETQLEAWATGEMARMTPQTFGHAIFETSTHEHLHLTAKTGLPSFHLSPIPDLLLKERIEDGSAESLARFNVRWVIAQGTSPSIGDANSERVLGTFHLRDIKEWDGKFARVEQGTGTVEVVRIDDDIVEVDVKASAPVLVALGMGYYPRWRARHASGASEPVYATPSIKDGKLHVVSAWLAPGRTTFTCDGPLPSDGRGRIVSLLAALVALASIVVWSVARWRVRLLRRAARGRAYVRARTGRLIELGVPALIAAMLVYGFVSDRAGAGAILVGSSGLRSSATVEARTAEGPWSTCGFSSVTGTYSCEGVVSVYDGTTNLLNDAPPSWAFITPAILATAEAPGVEIRITRRLRLAGRYWVGASTGTAKMTVGTDFSHEFGVRSTMEIPKGSYTVELTAAVPEGITPLALTLVEEKTLIADQSFLVAPPAAPPASVSAIH